MAKTIFNLALKCNASQFSFNYALSTDGHSQFELDVFFEEWQFPDGDTLHGFQLLFDDNQIICST